MQLPNFSIDEIFEIKNDKQFNELCLKMFEYQYYGIEIYHKFVNQIKIKPSQIQHYSEIPFLPIQFFKTHRVINQLLTSNLIFKSSGTTGERSKHYIFNEEIYKKSSKITFENFFGKIEDYVILGLLPSYIENGDSSLIYMVNYFMSNSKKKENGFFLNDFEKLAKVLEKLEKNKQKTILFGVSYALLDFSEKFPTQLKYVKIIETGGMKGRKKELTKMELLNTLKTNFNSEEIYSEYGMTELLSQSYSNSNGMYYSPNWKKIILRCLDNPLEIENKSTRGAINIIDLANVYSCSFIATQDLGKINQTHFEVLGRTDDSDIRGCSLLYNF